MAVAVPGKREAVLDCGRMHFWLNHHWMIKQLSVTHNRGGGRRERRGGKKQRKRRNWGKKDVRTDGWEKERSKAKERVAWDNPVTRAERQIMWGTYSVRGLGSCRYTFTCSYTCKCTCMCGASPDRWGSDDGFQELTGNLCTRSRWTNTQTKGGHAHSPIIEHTLAVTPSTRTYTGKHCLNKPTQKKTKLEHEIYL